MFKNKIVKSLLITTIILFVIGVLMLIIGMQTKLSYETIGVLGSSTIEKWSIADVIKDWNSSVGSMVGVNKANLFNVRSNLIDSKAWYDLIPPITEQGKIDMEFIDKMLVFANIAIAGFSFIIISIATAISTAIAAILLKDKE